GIGKVHELESRVAREHDAAHDGLHRFTAVACAGNPRERKPMTTVRTPTYQVLVEDIRALGVEQVFGLMSDDTAVFATALDSSGVRFYGARHENNAIAMAEGYAYASGGLGVAVIGRGPATANGLHGATYASRTG